jgi:hypothetical protein
MDIREIIIGKESERYTSIYFNDINKSPTEEEFKTKHDEIKTHFGLYKLREQRNRLLAESDWIMLRDVKLENIGEWETYRQALRDLPKTQTNLETDEIGNLLNVEYPTKPQMK